MAPVDQLLHWLNFFFPAVALGGFLAVLDQVFIRNRPKAPVFIAQAAINSIAGALTLMDGLWWFGRDGKMATYCALVLVCATSQAWVRVGAGRNRGRS